MSHRPVIPLSFALMISVACGDPDSGAEGRKAALDDAMSSQSDTEPSPATDGEDIQAERLLRDALAYQLCSKIGDTVEALSAGEGEGDAVVEGRLWLEHCDASVEDGDLAIEVRGRGWRWVSRETSKLGADFDLDQYVRFGVDLGARFEVEAEYAREHRMLIVWLRPRAITRVDIEPIGDIDVEEEGAWSEVLGTASGIFGSGPDEKAGSKVEEKGERRFERALGKGFTVAVDLCTGSSVSERDIVDTKTLVDRPEEKQDDEATVRIHGGGIDVAGPTDDPPIAYDITVSRGGVRAQLYCRDDAVRILEAILAGEDLPQLEPLAEARVSGSEPTRISASDATCQVYLVTRPTGDVGETTFRYSAHDGPGKAEPVVQCPE